MKNNKVIISVYATFIIALLMNFIPLFTIQTIGGTLFFATFIITYILKYSAEKESNTFYHYAYITKTLWIFSLFLTIGIIFATILADNAIINELMTNIQNGIILTEEQMTQKLVQYSVDNLVLFLITFIPTAAYFLYRLIKGLKLAGKNQVPQNPKNWF